MLLPLAEALPLASLITPTEQGIASRVLARTSGGNVTLFAFDAGEELSEHSTPFDALVLSLEGRLLLTVGGQPIETAPHSVVVMPANVPHAVRALDAARFLLIMLKDS